MSTPKVTHQPLEKKAAGGLEGADRMSRETALWTPSFGSPDQIINHAKPLADARAADMARNDGYTTGAVDIHRDSIVGSQYRLNAQPNWRALNAPQGWAEEFQQVVEARFQTIAESEDCWLDASRTLPFTMQVRMAIACFVITGEVLGTAEWIRETRRPCKTAVQLISPDRLSNKDGLEDTQYLRRGVVKDFRGRPVAYHIRRAHPAELMSPDLYEWDVIAAEKPWGRKQVIHIIDQLMPAQSRGVASMVAVLKQMRMTKKFQDVTLQNAVINASYAAAIESELPTVEAFAAIGAGGPNGPITGMNDYLGAYLSSLESYLEEASTISMDGAKIPHLFPGTKLQLKPAGTPGGVGTEYEQSLLRHIAAALGLSYEQFTRDYTKTNYSSARASANETNKNMAGKKKSVADRFAKNVYTLWLEEEIAAGNIPLPPGKRADWFYEPLVKDAISQCSWIGASRGQIDEMKETQAAILRIKSGLSTYEVECARLGVDFREVFEQRAREEGVLKTLGLTFSMDAQKQQGGTQANIAEDDPDRRPGANDQGDDE